MKRKSFLLSILALILIACAVIHPVMSYFTANADANGAIPLYFVYRTEIWDEVEDLVKTVRIQNMSELPDAEDIFHISEDHLPRLPFRVDCRDSLDTFIYYILQQHKNPQKRPNFIHIAQKQGKKFSEISTKKKEKKYKKVLMWKKMCSIIYRLDVR